MTLTNYAINMYPHQLRSNTRGNRTAKGRKKAKVSFKNCNVKGKEGKRSIIG